MRILSKFSVVAAAALWGGCVTLAVAQSNNDLPDIGSPAGTIANLDDEYPDRPHGHPRLA